jgi:hypothetical protein
VAKKQSGHLQALIRSIKDEWKGKYRKFPDQTILALQDERVLEAIEKRFEAQVGISDIRQLDYDFYSGLHNLVFEFAPSTAAVHAANAFLVILSSTGKVVALVDPFDPVQPNISVPPLPKDSEQPFVLDRPSGTGDIAFSDQQLYPVQVRSREFFQRINARTGRGIGVGDGDIWIWTTSYYTTWTPVGYMRDWMDDDSGLPTTVLV